MVSSLPMMTGAVVGLLVLLLIGLIWLTVRRADLRRDVWAGGMLAGATVAFFWRTLSGDVFQPADGGDLVSFLFPTYRFAASSLQAGQLPLWNPHLYGGAPFIGDIQAGFLYPPNLVLFLLHPAFDYHWMQWLSIGHIWWAGLGVYVLVRVLGYSRPAGLIAGLAFGFSDALFIHLGNLNLIAVLSWIGWVLAAYSLALKQRSLLWAGAAAIPFAIANYAGHAQSSYYIGLAIGVYTLVAVVAARPQQDDPASTGQNRLFAETVRFLASMLRFPLAVFVLTFLLTAPILLPALELLPFTGRADFAYQETVGFSLAPVPALVGLLTPGFFGRGPGLHWGLWDRVELPYAGMVTLLLAAAALLLPTQKKTRRLLPWLILGLFGGLVALGIYSPVHGWLTQLLPGFGSFRAPARAIVLWALSISVLAAAGLDGIWASWGAGTIQSQTSAYAKTLKLGGLALLLFITPLMFASLLVLQEDSVAFLRASVAALAVAKATAAWLAVWLLLSLVRGGRLTGSGLGWLFVPLLLVELAATGAYTDISETDPARGFDHPQIVSFLHAQMGISGATSGDSPSAPFRIDARTGIDDVWQPDTAALAGLQDVWGVANPLVLAHWERLWESTGGRDRRLYDLLNVRYVIVRDGTPLPDQFLLALDADGPLSVFENPDPLPRAWLVTDARTVADDAAALGAIIAPGFEPLETVILTGDNGSLASAESPGESMPISGDPAIVSYEANEIVLTVAPEEPGYLVFSEVWYPGWRATVDGVPTQVLTADFALRAVAVPAGESIVRLWYGPVSWRWGVALFGLGIILLGCLLVWTIRPGPFASTSRRRG